MKELVLPILGLAIVAFVASTSRIGALFLIIVVLALLLKGEQRFNL